MLSKKAKFLDNVGKILRVSCPRYIPYYKKIDELRGSSSPDERAIKKVFDQLKAVVGDVESDYERCLRMNLINRWENRVGKLQGDGTYKYMATPQVFDCLRGRWYWSHDNPGQKIYLGNDYLVSLLKEHHELVALEYSLTCHLDPLCFHEKADLRILMGQNANDRAVLFPDLRTAVSNHYRIHIFDVLDKFGDLRATERGVEGKNQHMMRIHEQVKRIRGAKRKTRAIMEKLELNKIAKIPQPTRRSKRSRVKKTGKST